MRITRVGASLAQVVLCGLWLGVCALFVAGVAPAAFSVLPTPTLAGDLVGRVLSVVFVSGIVVCAAVMVLGGWTDMASRWKPRVFVAALGGTGCSVAQFVVGRGIELVRRQIHGSVDSLAPSSPLRIAFGQLHVLSVALLSVAILSVLAVLVVAMRDILHPSS